MKNTVTMDLDYYDSMKEEIVELKSQIEKMKQSRVEELKSIIKIEDWYNSIGLNINLDSIVKELYGEEVERSGEIYKLVDGKVKNETIYTVWKSEKIEDEV